MIYFDSAATTLQKPPEVAKAVARGVNQLASPGRGGHPPSAAAGEIAYRCREVASTLFHMEDPQQVVFTMNATHGLNIAIRALVHEGDRVVISPWEHNAVTRTLASIPDVEVEIAQGDLFQNTQLIQSFATLMTSDVKAVIFTHISNVFGYILPIDEIAALCRSRNIPFIIDASQSAGNQPIHMDSLGARYIAMPGHKGLFGPQGTGLLLCDEIPPPLMTGGTGSESMAQTMPRFLPDRLEAGTHNMAGIAGLLAGMQYVQRVGVPAIHSMERNLMNRLSQGLAHIPQIEQFYTQDGSLQGGVLSLRAGDMDCEVVGELLAQRGICVRAGLHCAPLAHRSGGTLESGTVRVSFSPFNTAGEVDYFLEVLPDLLKYS